MTSNGPPLTPKLWLVAELVHEGLTNKEIGLRLDTGEDTIKHEIAEIMDRIGAVHRTRPEIAVWYERIARSRPQCPARNAK